VLHDEEEAAHVE
jgi:hypothetical protein